ncbi:MAG TPA: single-strand selective monofunctional uracil-DNA glycosylase [Polyangiaceae bacterium]|nr:single-strand selective monofunctional uracil-DNA glycosylase [Polyangiaceae bacterium]
MSLVRIDRKLSKAVSELSFAEPVCHVYNPLDYARGPHEAFLKRYGEGPKEVLLLGMNPGPWGMAQTGVPFGDVGLVRDWLGITGKVGRPEGEHPKRRIEGFDCARSEVSGSRLWGWAKERFGTPERFFERFFVINYCPLAFLEASGRNRTPDKLPKAEREALLDPCDEALRASVMLLRPKHVVGVGVWAKKVAERVVGDLDVSISSMLHPSPASPKANKGWAPQAEEDLEAAGITL